MRTIGVRWVVGVDDLVGLLQPWCFCDSVKKALFCSSFSEGLVA